jgi:hypothetical protein
MPTSSLSEKSDLTLSLTRSKPEDSESRSTKVSKRSPKPPSHLPYREPTTAEPSLHEQIEALSRDVSRCTTEVKKQGKELAAHGIVVEDDELTKLKKELVDLKKQKSVLEVEVENFRSVFTAMERTRQGAISSAELVMMQHETEKLKEEVAKLKEQNETLNLEIGNMKKLSANPTTTSNPTEDAPMSLSLEA